MLTREEATTTSQSYEDDDWVPPGWGSDEQVTAEGEAFAQWTQTMRPRA